jgi:hypothetical protein
VKNTHHIYSIPLLTNEFPLLKHQRWRKASQDQGYKRSLGKHHQHLQNLSQNIGHVPKFIRNAESTLDRTFGGGVHGGHHDKLFVESLAQKMHKEVASVTLSKDAMMAKRGSALQSGSTGLNFESGERRRARQAAPDKPRSISQLQTLPSQPEEDKDAFGHTDVPEIMIETLEIFDSVKAMKDQKPNVRDVSTLREQDNNNMPALNNLNGRFLPSYKLNITKTDQYSALKRMDASIVDSNWCYKKSKFPKAESLEEIRRFLDRRLKALNCPPVGPDLRRLQVYRECFDKVIQEFKLYGPLLAQIKVDAQRVSRCYKAAF